LRERIGKRQGRGLGDSSKNMIMTKRERRNGKERYKTRKRALINFRQVRTWLKVRLGNK